MNLPGSAGKRLTEVNTQQDQSVNAQSNLYQPLTTSRLVEIEALPRRHPILHWGAFGISLVSFALILLWVLSARGAVPLFWMGLDVGLGVVFLVEFFTRSGFRWARWGYLRTRFFDFVAIIPAMAMVHHGWAGETVWVWIILVARAARMIDRFLGDGFVRRNSLALLEGFEEEITDRVLDRILIRIQADLNSAGFSHGVAEALSRNKSAILEKVHETTPQNGLIRLVGLNAAIERAEEKTFDAVTEVINSEEVNRAVRDVVDSSFSRMRNELGKKKWRQHLGIKPAKTG